MTHLDIPEISPLLLASLPSSLTHLTVRPGEDETRFLHAFECVPTSIESLNIASHTQPTAELLETLFETIQPFQKLKHFHLELYFELEAESESTLWSRLLRLLPNVEELFIVANNLKIGVEPKHLKMLNPLTLRSLTIPMSDECFAVDDGQSCIQSMLPRLTDLYIGYKQEAQTIDISTLPTMLTSLNINARVSLSSLVHLPKTLAQLHISKILVKEWSDEVCGLFCDVRTSDGTLITTCRTSMDIANATTLRVDSCIYLSIDLRGESPFFSSSTDYLPIQPGYLLRTRSYLSWRILPQFPSSLTELIIAEERDMDLTLTPLALPNLKILSIPYYSQSLADFKTLEKLESSHHPDWENPEDPEDLNIVINYPPNLSHLVLRSASHQGAYPPGLTYLEGNFGASHHPDFATLPHLQTLIIRDCKHDWTRIDIPATLTHLELPLSDRSEIDFSAFFQRLPNLLHFELLSYVTATLLEKIFIPSFPPQAIFKCEKVSLSWINIETIASRVDCPEDRTLSTDLDTCASVILRYAYPRLRCKEVANHSDSEQYDTEFSAKLWSTLFRYLSPSILTLELPQFPGIAGYPTQQCFPSGMVRLGFHELDPVVPLTTIQLPPTLKTLVIGGITTHLQLLLDSLPPSLTHLIVKISTITTTHTNWPPCLKYLHLCGIDQTGA